MALLRGATQVLDNSINISKIVTDFLNGSNWDITNGNNNATITGLANGANPHDAVNYQQLIDLINGRQWKDSVRAFASVNVTLSGNQTVDGVSLADGDRVATLNQTTTSEDGVYIVDTGGAWTRAADWASGDGAANYSFYVEEGTNYADSQWTISNDSSSDTIGTHDLIPSQTGGAGTIVAGAGLTLTGNTIDVIAADNSLLVNADDMQVQIGTDNGNSLEVTTTGLELLANVTGDRTFSGSNFTISASAGVNINGGTEAGYIQIGNTNVTSFDIVVSDLLNLTDFQILNSTTTTPIPLSVVTTVDYGSGTNDGDVIDDFRNAFTDDAIINAIMENHAAIIASGNDLSDAYYAGVGTPGTPANYIIDMTDGNIMWKLHPSTSITDANWTVEDGVGTSKSIIAAHSHYDGSTQDYSSLHLYANAYANGADNSKGIDIASYADGASTVAGEINISTDNLTNGATGASINISSGDELVMGAVNMAVLGSDTNVVALYGTKFQLLDSTHTNLYESELEGIRIANYATASLPTVQANSFGALVFDTDDDRPKVWVTDADGIGTDGWLKLMVEGDSTNYTFENGLHEDTTVVKMGGLFTEDTYLGYDSGTSGTSDFKFRVYSGGDSVDDRSKLWMEPTKILLGYDDTVAATGGNLIVADSGIALGWSDSNNAIKGTHLYIDNETNNQKMTIYGDISHNSFGGIMYDSDYSANYTLRSLVDKEYVDKKAAPTRIVAVFSDSNVDITSAPATIDGITLANGDIIALLNQTTTTEDGIYVYDASGSAMVRATDFATGLSVGGYTIIVEEGTNNADKVFLITNDKGSDVVGTDDLAYTLINGASTIDLNVAYENGAGSIATPVNQIIEMDSGNANWKLTPASTYTPAIFSITNETGIQGIFVEKTDSGATNTYTSVTLKSESNSGTGNGIIITDTASGGTGGGVNISTVTGLGTAGDINLNSANAVLIETDATTGGNITINAQNNQEVGISADDMITLYAGHRLNLASSGNEVRISATTSTISFADLEVANATTTTGIPFAITTTIDHGSGTASGDLINDFRTKFTDEAIINAIMENADAIASASSTLDEAYDAEGGTTGAHADVTITVDSGMVNWDLQSATANNDFRILLDSNVNPIFEVDADTGNVGLGTATTPGTQLHVHSFTDDDYKASIGVTRMTTTAGKSATVGVGRLRGTSFGSPASVLTDDLLGTFLWSGQLDTTPGHFDAGAGFQALATEDWDATHRGTKLNLVSALTGTATRTSVFTVEGDGSLTVGVTANYETLVTDDDDIPNKKYVDDKVSSSGETIDEPGVIIDANAGTFRIVGKIDLTKVKIYLNGNRLSPPEISSIANGTGGEAGNTVVTINNANQVLTAGDAIYCDFIE